MTSPSVDTPPATPGRDDTRGARWVWIGLLSAVAVVFVIAVIGMLHSGSDGVGRNRGPGSEIAPGTQPAQDIDRSRAP
jgi:hypothetical protein